MVKTSSGLTDRADVDDVILQGSCFGPVECSVTVDRIGKVSEEKNVHQYKYKDLVNIMALSMVDDILSLNKCGFQSFAANTFINGKIEMMKFTLGKKKCHQLHVGKSNPCCPTLQVHGEDIDLVENDKYLGDVIATTIQSNGSNQLNINKRKGAAMGVKTQIMLILKTVSLGHHYFEIAVLLRESLLISSSLFNAEVWYALTKAQVGELEEIDRS